MYTTLRKAVILDTWILPRTTNINFLLTTSADQQECRLWELLNWLPKGQCFDLKFSQLFLKEMYGDQSGQFVCGSYGLKGQRNQTDWCGYSLKQILTWPFRNVHFDNGLGNFPAALATFTLGFKYQHQNSYTVLLPNGL